MVDKWASTRGTFGETTAASESVSTPSKDHDSLANRPLDIQRALEQLGNDRELFDEALEVFINTIPALVAELQLAVSNADSGQLQAAAHNLKGAASNICAKPIHRAAQRLEEMGKQNEFQEGASVLVDLQEHLDRLREFAPTLRTQ